MNKEEEARLIEAIRRAEQGHRGEVLVHVERHCKGGSALARAMGLFEKLGMRGTATDTAVILYVALEDRKTAVYAGRGVHGAAMPGFWETVVDAVEEGFRKGEPVTGLVTAVERIGGLLLTAVPGRDTAGNELPDRVNQG
ncbi:TPM domain-containing protein [Archangium lipolyticum]|uniref:TPM domain-containing protein n=1 Tax=Archangium lipolyticum TaxID=2970465 RepID=UPI00214A3C39|nr:TPM domain-containing protein [Archangium lipolyticum]